MDMNHMFADQMDTNSDQKQIDVHGDDSEVDVSSINADLSAFGFDQHTSSRSEVAFESNSVQFDNSARPQLVHCHSGSQVNRSSSYSVPQMEISKEIELLQY